MRINNYEIIDLRENYASQIIMKLMFRKVVEVKVPVAQFHHYRMRTQNYTLLYLAKVFNNR